MNLQWYLHLPLALYRQAFILQAVQKNGEVLRYACGWHSEPEVVLTAIEKAEKAGVENQSGWWFGTFLFSIIILGSSSSELTFIFFRGVETTNQ